MLPLLIFTADLARLEVACIWQPSCPPEAPMPHIFLRAVITQAAEAAFSMDARASQECFVGWKRGREAGDPESQQKVADIMPASRSYVGRSSF